MMKLNIQRFASGSFELAKATGNASWKSLQGKIEWSSVASGSEENQSVVTTKLYAKTWTGGTSGKNWRGYVKVGGNTAHSFSSLSSSKTISSSYVLLATYTDTIKHNDNGTCSINISGYVQGPNETSLEGVRSSGNKTVTLDTIPRATTLDSFSGGKRIGVSNDVIINFTKKKSTFTTTLAYATKSDYSDMTTIVEKSPNASTYSWTLPIELLNKIPNSKTLTIYVMLATFDGDTQIGTAQIESFTANVYADNCRPIWETHTIEETDTTAKQLVTTANKFVANLSKPKFTFEATGQYGATISYYQINNTTRTSGFTDSSFNINGYTLKVVDSRGITNTYTFSLSYVPYFTPVFEEVKLFRDVPTSDKVFSYFKIKFFNNTSSVKFDNPQALSYKFNYQESGGTAQEKAITPEIYDDGTSRYAESETELGNTFNYKKSVDWTFSFVDLTGKTFTTNATLPMGIPIMNGKMNADGEQELYINGEIKGEGIEPFIKKDSEARVSNVVSKNLFDESTIVTNKYINANGEELTNNEAKIEGYIKVVPNEIYTFSANSSTSGTVRIHGYNVNKEWVSQLTTVTTSSSYNKTFTIPSDVEYIRISMPIADTNIQLEQGSTATDYVPYLNLKEAMPKLNVINVEKSNYVKQGDITVIQSGNIVLVEISELYLTEDRQEWSTFIAYGLPPAYIPNDYYWTKGILLDNKGVITVDRNGNLFLSQRTNVQLANNDYNGQMVYITLD